VNLLVRTLKH